MEDEISYNPVTFRNENLDKTRHQGAEISIDWQFRKLFRLIANYTLQEAFFREGTNRDKDVPLVPNHMANAALEIYLPWSFTLRPEFRYVGEQYFGSDNDNSVGKLDSYTIVNLYLRWQPDWKAFGSLNRAFSWEWRTCSTRSMSPRATRPSRGHILPRTGNQLPGRDFALLLINIFLEKQRQIIIG